jgi:signal transduction histidine kinase
MDHFPIHRGRRDLWLPVLVVALGSALSVGVWGVLIAERRQATLARTSEVAVQTRQLVADGVERYVGALHELAGLWALVGQRPIEHWNADVAMLKHNFPGLDYVAWTRADSDEYRVSRGANPSDLALPDPGDFGPGSAPALIGPERTRAGAPSLRILLPVGPASKQGLLVARIDLETLLSRLLRGKSLGYAVSIRWGDEEIFSRGEPSADRWQQWWRIEEDVALPRGIVWHLVERPTPELAASVLTPIPHYLLASGLLLSLLLAGLTHQLRLTLRQSRFLAASNRALEERGDELERRVAERTRELEEAVGELRAFNQTVSHDLRSPLATVLNFTTILEEDHRDRPLDAKGLEIVKRIRRSAERATGLLEGLLLLSRAGRAALDIGPVDMRRLAQEIFAQVRVAEYDASGVEFVVEDLPEAEGDHALLGDVFSNLFTNALKYSRGRENRRISVRGFVDGEECIFEVADNGRGFDMRFAAKLFEMFERLDSEDDVEGTGAGLAIVARIVARHGGRVWAESKPGEGARFLFSLPRQRGDGP